MDEIAGINKIAAMVTMKILKGRNSWGPKRELSKVPTLVPPVPTPP
jgi:hypothetical protein